MYKSLSNNKFNIKKTIFGHICSSNQFYSIHTPHTKFGLNRNMQHYFHVNCYLKATCNILIRNCVSSLLSMHNSGFVCFRPIQFSNSQEPFIQLKNQYELLYILCWVAVLLNLNIVIK